MAWVDGFPFTENFIHIVEMFRYDILTFFTFIVGRHITPSAVFCRPKLVFGVFILLCQICQFVLALLWRFVAVYVLFLAPRVKLASNREPFRGAEGFVSQLIFFFSNSSTKIFSSVSIQRFFFFGPMLLLLLWLFSCNCEPGRSEWGHTEDE